MANDSLAQYEEWHRRYNVTIAPLDELSLKVWHNTVLTHLLPFGIEGKKIAEIGCGNGDFSNYLSLNYQSDITGLDFSTESIRIANLKKEKFNAATSKFIVGDAQNLPFDNEFFDCIVSCECLEHVPEPQKMIDELYRVVKKGGIVILTTENYSNAYGYYIPYLKLIGKPYDSGSSVQPVEHFFVYWNVVKKFKRAGFSVVKTYSRQYILLLLPGVSPSRFTIPVVKNAILRILLKPLGRRFTYVTKK